MALENGNRRQDADIDARLVVAHRLRGELERSLQHVESLLEADDGSIGLDETERESCNGSRAAVPYTQRKLPTNRPVRSAVLAGTLTPHSPVA